MPFYQFTILAHLSALPFLPSVSISCPVGVYVFYHSLRPYRFNHFPNFTSAYHFSALVGFIVLPPESISDPACFNILPFSPSLFYRFPFLPMYHFSALIFLPFYHSHQFSALPFLTLYHFRPCLFYHFTMRQFCHFIAYWFPNLPFGPIFGPGGFKILTTSYPS